MARPREFDRDEALQKAMRTFWSKGYEATSVSDLTQAMDLSRSSLYETFGDKEELFLEALKYYSETLGKRRSAMLAKDGSAKGAIEDYLLAAVRFVTREDNPGGCFVTNTATALGSLDEKVEALIKRGMEEQEEDLYRRLEKGVQDGEIGSDKDIRALARFFVGVLRGVSVIARTNRDRKALEGIVYLSMNVMG